MEVGWEPCRSHAERRFVVIFGQCWHCWGLERCRFVSLSIFPAFFFSFSDDLFFLPLFRTSCVSANSSLEQVCNFDVFFLPIVFCFSRFSAANLEKLISKR